MSALELVMMKRVGELNAEVKLLKAEVERLEASRTRTIISNELLQAKVLRLTKYGDVLESGLRTLPGDYPRCLANEWKAAKEGKQS